MPVDRDRLDQQLAKLEKYIDELKGMRDRPESEFTDGSLTEAAAERRVYKAMQAALDIAQQLSASLGFGPPRFYRDLFGQLGEKEVISRELEEKLKAMAGMRNRLAHEYGKVDPKEIYKVIQEDYKDLIEFAGAVVRFVEKKDGRA